MKYLNQCTFSRVPVGAEFFQNGNRCRKVSTRTADILDLAAARRFYFGMREWVTVSDKVWADILAINSQVKK